MTDLFLKIVDMSINASWLILAVLILRVVLKKAPKSITFLLWAFVGIRLICPISFESIYSLVPDHTEMANQAVSFVNENSTQLLFSSENVVQTLGTSQVSFMNLFIKVLCVIWILGVASALIYNMWSYEKLQRQVEVSLHVKDNVYFCENCESPFILGIIHPKIYLPISMDQKFMESVLAHERMHLKRKDHIWKILGYLIFVIHWFNPVVWIAYFSFNKDIELACDEMTIQSMDIKSKKEYCNALLSLSEETKYLPVYPLAFGEIGVKERIKKITNYKKPTFWIVLVAIVLCIVTLIGFMSNPYSYGNSIKVTYNGESKKYTYDELFEWNNWIYPSTYLDENMEELVVEGKYTTVNESFFSNMNIMFYDTITVISKDGTKVTFNKSDSLKINELSELKFDMLWMEKDSITYLHTHTEMGEDITSARTNYVDQKIENVKEIIVESAYPYR